MASEPELQPDTGPSFAQSVLGKAFFEDSNVRRFLALSPTVQVATITAVLASLVLIPYLGAVGLWDPWEVHYGEIARSMVRRGDYVHMYWENGWLFSKPVMTMWLMALGMNIVGTERTESFVALGTEWGMRLPFALMSIVAVVLLALAVSRTVNRRAGLATGFALITMPTWFLISRQAVTDTPFVSAMAAAMACGAIGLLDPGTKRRAAWWYAFYVFAGIATLAKGPAGIAFPAAVLLVYAALAVIPWSVPSLKAHGAWLVRRAGVPLLVAAGVAVVATPIFEAIIGSLRHTDHGFFEALGLLRGKGKAPMDAQQAVVNGILAGLTAFLAGVAAFVGTLRRRLPEKDQVPVLWAEFFRMRLGTGILVFFAVALPWYFYMCLFPENGNAEEGTLFWARFFVHDNINRVFSGVHTTTPGGTFTYFIEQGGFGIFPWVAAVPGAFAVAARFKLRRGPVADRMGILAVVWLAITFAVIGSMQTKFHHYLMPVLPPLAVLIGIFVDRLWREGLGRHAVALLFGAVLLVLVGKDLVTTPKHFTDLFVYNYDRPFPSDLWSRYLRFDGLSLNVGDSPKTLLPPHTFSFAMKDVFGFLLTAVVLVLVLAAGLLRDRRLVFGTFLAATLSFTLWFNWNHWVDLSHHWTQRDLFWRYYELRKPDEPITAFLMNWRGETFYSRNTVKQIKDNGKLAQYAALPGRKWALVEHYRLGILKSAVGAGRTVTVMTAPEMNNKFVLVAID